MKDGEIGMKYKKKLSHLLHSMTSFIILLITGRLVNILVTDTLGSCYLTEQLAFILSVAAAVVCFKIMPQDITPTANSSDDKDDVPPALKQNRTISALHTVITFCTMVALMYIVSYFVGSEKAAEVRLDPVYLISLIILHPFLEEYVFRSLYYGELRLLNPVFACLAQSTMFALSHDTVNGMFFALVCGVALGALVENTGRWYCAIAAHAALNLRSLLFSTVLADNPAIRPQIDAAIIALGLASLVLLLVLQNRKSEAQ